MGVFDVADYESEIKFSGKKNGRSIIADDFPKNAQRKKKSTKFLFS